MSHLIRMRMMIMRVCFIVGKHSNATERKRMWSNEIGFNVSLSPPNRNSNILNVGWGKGEKVILYGLTSEK